MEQKEFVTLVEDLEVYAREHPAAYKLRVGLLAAFGYFVLIGTVGVVLLIVAGSIYLALNGMMNIVLIKFLIIPIGAGAVVLRSLWVEFPKPEGYRLRPADAPRLFEVVNRIRTATKGPKVHKLQLTAEFNASIVQRPRLGIFGWHENYLRIGLPLLHGLAPDEVRAVIAHEFGHLSRKHSAGAGWIYRVRQTWLQVLANTEKHHRYGTGIFHRIFNWYAPYFSAYSWVLARATEYEADKCAGILAGKQNAARALINLELKERAVNAEFWAEFYRGADTQPEPPQEIFSALLEWVRKPVTPDVAQIWFAQSLSHKHNYADSHPALADRIEAIGYPNVRQQPDLELFVKNSNQCGDEYFLQKAPADFIAGKNREWRESARASWNERRAFVDEANKALAALELKSKTQELTIDERLELANLVARTRGKAATVPLLQEIIALEPDHAVANFALGDALLDQLDEAGVSYIEKAMEKDVHCVPSGCHSIFMFLVGLKRMEEAQKYGQRGHTYQQTVDLAQEERSNISHNDDFKYHGVAPDALVALRAQLARYSNLASAHLVQKVVKHFPEDPSFVLAIVRKRSWYQSQDNNLDQHLLNELAQGLAVPGYTQIVALEHKNYKPLRKVLSQIRGAEIYRAVA